MTQNESRNHRRESMKRSSLWINEPRTLIQRISHASAAAARFAIALVGVFATWALLTLLIVNVLQALGLASELAVGAVALGALVFCVVFALEMFLKP